MKRGSSLPRFRSRRRTLSLALISTLLALTVVSCSSRQDSRDRPLKIAIEAGPVQLDPRLATDAYGQRIGSLLYSRLLRLDSATRLRGDLAESWEANAPDRYTFRLRKNLRFSDGSTLNSEDVRYTFESILDPGTASPHRKTFESIDHIDTPDGDTVVFYLKRPYAPFLYNLTAGIVSKAKGAGIGSGPYFLKTLIPDEKLVLEANRYFHDPAPGIKDIEIKIIPEDTVREMELQKGSVDLIENALPPDFIPYLEKDPHFSVYKTEGTTYAYLGLNLQDPVLSNRKVRQALAYAIDREAIIRDILKGYGRAASGVLSSSHWAYEGGVESYPYDPKKSSALLDEAGFRIPKPGEPRLHLTYKTSQNDLSKRIGEVIQQQLNEVGIQMEIRTYEWGTFYSDIKSGNFQLYSLRWVGVVDPDIYFDLFHSQSVPPAGANRGHYSNPEVDLLVEEGRTTADPEKRKAIYQKVQKIIASDLPYISLWTFSNVAVLKKGLSGFAPDPSGDFYPFVNLKWTGN